VDIASSTNRNAPPPPPPPPPTSKKKKKKEKKDITSSWVTRGREKSGADQGKIKFRIIPKESEPIL